MDKKIILHDNEKFEDTCGFLKGKVQIKLAGTDKVLFEGFNKVTLMGAELLMRSLFFGGTTASSDTCAYKTIESLLSTKPFCSNSDNSVKFNTPVYDIATTGGGTVGNSTESASGHKCLWFAVGNDGCVNGQSFTIKEVQRNQPIDHLSYIPFAMCSQTEARLRAQSGYGLAVKNANDDKYGLFLKQFSSLPSITIKDDTEQKYYYNNISNKANTLGYGSEDQTPQAYIEMRMAITADDCREYFAAINDTNRIINTISIMSAIPSNIDGTSIYLPRYVRPVTKLNFPSESLADDSKGLDITYQIYF